MGIEGKTIVVTGGFGAVGRAVADEAMRRGARVALVDRAHTSPGEAKALLLSDVDLTDLASAEAAMARAAHDSGGIDVLLNIAGGFRWQTLEAGELAAWDQLYDLNLKTAVTACRAALPYLRLSPAGRIVNWARPRRSTLAREWAPTPHRRPESSS